jgi:cytochrome c biogenesis protein CcmG/thiol:disulfide interchange protein DsbE
MKSSPRWLTFALPLVLFLALVALLFSRNGSDPSFLPSARLGQAVPAFTLPSLAAPELKLDESLLKGHVTLLNVWATWCVSCLVENPVLLSLSDQGVRIIGVNYKDNRQAALGWLANNGNAFDQVIFDEDGSLGIDLGVYGAPETYLVDGNGIIRYRAVGVLDPKAWQTEIKPRYDALYAEYNDALGLTQEAVK